MVKKTDEELEIDLGKLLRILWRSAALILIIGILFSAAFFMYSRMYITPKYQANALFYVNNSTFSISNAVRISTSELNAASDLVSTYVAILQSRANMELVIQESGVNYSYEQLRKMVSASAVNSTGLFRVMVTSSNPDEARTLANVIADILPSKISEIVTNSNIVVVDYAVTPRGRISPNYFKNAAIGLLLGIVLASAIVIVRSLMDDVIHDEDYLLDNFKHPVLATIPDLMARTPKRYGYYGSSGKPSRKGGLD